MILQLTLLLFFREEWAGDKADVTNWVLGKFKPSEKVLLDDSYIEFLNIIDFLADLQIEKAQLRLHTE